MATGPSPHSLYPTPPPSLRPDPRPTPRPAAPRLGQLFMFIPNCMSDEERGGTEGCTNAPIPPLKLFSGFSLWPVSPSSRNHTTTRKHSLRQLSQRASVRPPPTRARVCCSVFCFPPLAGVCARRVKTLLREEEVDRARARPTTSEKARAPPRTKPRLFGLSYAASALPPATSF